MKHPGQLGDTDVADAIVSSVRLVLDGAAQAVAIDYWDMSRAAHGAVVEALETCADPAARDALRGLVDAPDDHGAAARLRELVVRRLADGDERWDATARAAAHADTTSRLVAHTGDRFVAGGPAVVAEDLERLPAPARRGPAGSPPVAVVLPFRDTTASRSRLRNLLACVRALADQTLDRAQYRVVVVEADAEPRWAETVRPLVDAYVHLPWSGHFTKAWAVNVGVVQASGAAPLLCVLDGDVLVDRDFLRRNVARLGHRGRQAHLPFRDALCLDAGSTSLAVRRRVLEGEAEVDAAELRGAVLRRPPGHCVWVRRELFDRVGGFDERFVGWGGEDLDLVFRLDVVGAVDRYDDPLLHLDHDRPQTQEDGRRFYAGRTLLSWAPIDPVGNPAAPARSGDDDLAGLIERGDDALLDR